MSARPSPHRYLHTFAASIAGGALVGALMYLPDRPLRRVYYGLALAEGEHGPWGFLTANILGWLLHEIYDAPTHYNTKPSTR